MARTGLSREESFLGIAQRSIIVMVAYIPSDTLSSYLRVASVGLWVERLPDGRAALVCKIPETAIKAIYRRATTTLLMASVRAESLTVLCLGLWVDDERDRPFKVTMVNSSEEDKATLIGILEAGSVALHCLNELNHPALSGSCTLDADAAAAAAAALRASEHWILTPAFSNTASMQDLARVLHLALDRFQAHIHTSGAEVGVTDIGFTARVPMTLEVWPPIEIFEASPTSVSGPFIINDTNEGARLENMILSVLDYVYPGRAYVSPHVEDAGISRELADALAFDELVICVVQAKALAVLGVDRDRPSSRRIANVEKDIKKGLKQLAGAMSNIRSAVPMSTRDGSSIGVPGRQASPAHAILVLSEMYFGIDWKAVARILAEASQSDVRQGLFHVMDIQELAALAIDCEDSAMFNNRLIQRWFAVQERGTAYLRTKRHP